MGRPEGQDRRWSVPGSGFARPVIFTPPIFYRCLPRMPGTDSVKDLGLKMGRPEGQERAVVSSGLRVRASGDLLPLPSFTDPFPICPGPEDSVKDLGLKMGRPEGPEQAMVSSGLRVRASGDLLPLPSFTDAFPACPKPETR
jgi:hypothetical protein